VSGKQLAEGGKQLVIRALKKFFPFSPSPLRGEGWGGGEGNLFSGPINNSSLNERPFPSRYRLMGDFKTANRKQKTENRN
jgi:hypothetical protein